MTATAAAQLCCDSEDSPNCHVVLCSIATTCIVPTLLQNIFTGEDSAKVTPHCSSWSR